MGNLSLASRPVVNYRVCVGVFWVLCKNTHEMIFDVRMKDYRFIYVHVRKYGTKTCEKIHIYDCTLNLKQNVSQSQKYRKILFNIV